MKRVKFVLEDGPHVIPLMFSKSPRLFINSGRKAVAFQNEKGRLTGPLHDGIIITWGFEMKLIAGRSGT
ncbi:hypothetical protein [Maridesulfovibrio bastinii]|uniref:hypothetical protein n=1 Tax=Maridesulfovibrio bastinii TaxID=47157 RepID=UPI000406AE5A|nr:hypothetical protein [Maridesulfovibrio bastinii]